MKSPRARSASPDRMLAMVLAVLWCAVAMTWSAPPSPGRAQSPSVQFTDVTRAARIAFVHSFGDSRLSNIIEGVGAGAAWLDYDQDGWMDLYLATGRLHPGLSDGAAPAGTPRNTLYRNKGDGTFEDVTARAGVACEGCFSMGLAV